MRQRPSGTDPQTAHQFAVFKEQLDGIGHAVAAMAAGGVEDHDLKRLEQRLDGIADHLGRLEQPRWEGALARHIGALADRIDALADQPSVDPQVIARLDAIARKVEAFDPDTLREQLTEPLRRLSARIDDVHADLSATNGNQEMLYRRLRDLEAQFDNHMALRDEPGAEDLSTVKPLAADLRALEDLARKSDERNSRTFEAVHDSLLKIAGRMQALEDRRQSQAAERGGRADLPPTPVAGIRPDETPPLSVEPRNLSDKTLLMGLMERLRRSRDRIPPADRRILKDTETVCSIDPSEAAATVHAIDEGGAADRPLEPGSGAPGFIRPAGVSLAHGGSGRDHPTVGTTDLIAAARRAAQAATDEATEADKIAGEQAAGGSPTRSTGWHRPILLAAGAMLLAVLAYPLLTGSRDAVPSSTRMAPPPPAKMEPVAPPVPAAADELPKVRVAGERSDDDSESKAPSILTAEPSPPQRLSRQNGVQASDRFTPGRDRPRTDALPETVAPPALREAAIAGDGVALFEIGARYEEGRGVAADPTEAARWYRHAADAGFAPAQYRLADLFENGTGVERDPSAALRWYRMAAEQGHAGAMHNLAVLYATDTADPRAAARWFERAANLGIAESQYHLARLYADGQGVPRDPEQAYKWFAIAAETGHREARRGRDALAESLNGEAALFVRAQVEQWASRPLVEAANRVRIPDAWGGTKTSSSERDRRQTVLRVQKLLTRSGFDTQGVDGFIGDKTIAAIKAFQNSVGLEPTGTVDEALLYQLLDRSG